MYATRQFLWPALCAGLLWFGITAGCNRSADEQPVQPPESAYSEPTLTPWTPSPGEPPSATIRLLFLGNSHIRAGGVVGLVEQFIRLADPQTVPWCQRIQGPFLESLYARQAVQQQISDGDWDVVILQGQKISMSGKYKYPIEPAVSLGKLAESSGARTLLFSEWGRRGVAGETQRTQDVYQLIADQTAAQIAPVGLAWELAMQRNPDLELHARDGNHSSTEGAFLTASVLYGSICRRSPADLPPLDEAPVDPDLQKFFHNCAADVLRDWPGWSDDQSEPRTDAAAVDANPRWYRGNLHTHSLWSDGDDFPEMITGWYADHGYHFLAMTDHNILARGERWMDEARIEQRGGEECLEKYRQAFGDTMLQTRQHDDKTQFRLTPLAEYRTLFEKPGEFLLIEGEEVSDAVEGLPVHLNATHLKQLLQPTGGATVCEAIGNNLRVAAEQSKRIGRPILMHINHPNFGWAITAEDLAVVSQARFVEVYNGHNGVNHQGDANHPGVERVWDIANTLRIDKFDVPPLYGLATDDSHYYHGRPGSHPGRGWVMVRADELCADAILNAMQRGEFFASSGVSLAVVEYDYGARELRLSIDAEEGVSYQTQFIGTRRGYNQDVQPATDADGNPIRATRKYSAEIGEVLATDPSDQPVYKLKGDELYVRAVVTSTRPHPDPSFAGQTEQAWTQPVGWEK